MASAFTHAFFAASLGSVMTPGRKKLVFLGAVLSVLPDADVIGFAFGIPYAHMLGHRGLSHSLAFAACLAAGFTLAAARGERGDVSRPRLAAYLFFATASHGALDALTDGGLGVAFFAPFSDHRYFFPWRPIVVSPISVWRFFTGRGLDVLASELVVVWIPALVGATIGWLVRQRRRAGPT